MMEVFARFSALARSGRYNVPAGLLAGGKRFSAVQAMLDIEIERWIVESGRGIEVSPETLLVDQIRRVGIAGHSMAEDHTLRRMRKDIWYPQLMDHGSSEIGQEYVNDMTNTATRRIEKLLSKGDLYEADPAMQRAIDEVVRAAEAELLS